MKKNKIIILSIIGLCVAVKLGSKPIAEKRLDNMLGSFPFGANININHLESDVFYLPYGSSDDKESQTVLWKSSNPDILDIKGNEVFVSHAGNPDDYVNPVVLEASLRYPDIPFIGSKVTKEYLFTVIPDISSQSTASIESINPYDKSSFDNYGRDMTVMFDEDGNAERLFGDFKGLKVLNKEDAFAVAESYRVIQRIPDEYEFKFADVSSGRHKGNDKCFTTYYFDVAYNGVPVINKGIVIDVIDGELSGIIFHRIKDIRNSEVPKEYAFEQDSLAALAKETAASLGYEDCTVINKDDYSKEELDELYIKNLYDDSEPPLFVIMGKSYNDGIPMLHVYNNREEEIILINLLDRSFECMSSIRCFSKTIDDSDELLENDWHYIKKKNPVRISTAESESGEKLQFETYDGHALWLASDVDNLLEGDSFNLKVYKMNEGGFLSPRELIPISDANHHFKDSVSAEAYCYVLDTVNWYQNVFGRSSYDGAGSPFNIYTNYTSGKYNKDNAFWNSVKENIYVSPKAYGEYTKAERPEILAHEFTHGVCDGYMDYSGNKESVLYTQSINEAYADIFACFICEKDEWLLGYSKKFYQKADGTISETTGYDRDLTFENQDKLKKTSDGNIPKAAPMTFDEFQYTTEDSSYYMHSNGIMLSNIAYRMYKSDLFTDEECQWIWYNSLRYGFPSYANYGTVRDNVLMAMDGLCCSNEQKAFVSHLFDEKKIYGSDIMEQKYSPLVGTANLALNLEEHDIYVIVLPDVKDKDTVNVQMFCQGDDFSYEKRVELSNKMEEAIQNKTDEMGLNIKINFGFSYKTPFLCGLADRFCKDMPGKFSLDKFVEMQSESIYGNFSNGLDFGYHFHTSLFNICNELGIIVFEPREPGYVFRFHSILMERCGDIAEK